MVKRIKEKNIFRKKKCEEYAPTVDYLRAEGFSLWGTFSLYVFP